MDPDNKKESAAANQPSSTVDQDEGPPPSYQEATAGKPTEGDSRRRAEEEDTLTPDEIELVLRTQGERNFPSTESIPDETRDAPSEDELSPSEAAAVLRVQDQRRSYLPYGERRESYEEAIEMIDKGGENGNVDLEPGSGADNGRAPEAVPETSFQSVDSPDVAAEEGRRSRTSTERVTGWKILCSPREYLNSLSRTRLILLTGLATFLVGFIIFLGVFPNSFVYLDYHDIALKQSKMTGSVDRETVYYPGCYVLGPDTQFIRFKATANDITVTMSVFTTNTLSITISFSLQYFLRPAEVGKLFTMFEHNYDPFIRSVVESSIRNYAATRLTLDEFRFNRTEIEKNLHNLLRLKLGGDCCPECCPSGCQSNTICDLCSRQSSCDQGYHIDIRYFFLLAVKIPEEIFDRYLKRTLLEVETEQELFHQEYQVIIKQTKQMTSLILNEAEQIIANATAHADRITTEAEADREKVVQKAYAQAMKGFYSSLNVTREDRKLSLMLAHTLKDVQENLQFGYGYEKETLYTP